MKKKLLLVLCALFLITGCKDVKLKDGENAVVTFKDGGISSNELYESLKETYGAEKLMDLIDSNLLSKKYKADKEENDYVTQNVKAIKENAESMGADLELYLNYYYGVASEKAFGDYLRLNYRRDKWAKEYAKETVTDKQINQYYETEIFGDIEASHILITVDVKSDATDEEKKEAEKKAEQKAKDLIEKLKKGADFATLAKENSKDESTKDDGGSLGKVNKGSVNEDVLNKLRTMKNGSYSTSPVKSSEGYHIVYRKSQDEKPELTDELKETIIETVSLEVASESGFQNTALKALREKNEMKFVDTYLESDFNDLVKRYDNQK